jgi:phytoene dehydrogenase-like protein
VNDASAGLDSNYDVVVIGAGHNGLVAANYLVDAGFSVVVVEASDYIGGLTATRFAIASAPQHAINSYSVDAFFWDSFPPAHELRLENYGLLRAPIDPGHVYLHPDGSSIAFWADARKTVEEIRHFSPADAHAYERFSNVIGVFADVALRMARTNPTRLDWSAIGYVAKRVFAARGMLKEFMSLPFLSVSDVIAERFEHPIVRDALHASAGATIPNNQSGTGVCFLWLATMHRYACARPIGGVQAIPNALARRLTEKGGVIRTNARVGEILVSGGRANGIALADGTTIAARKAVFGTCDPRTTLDRLLPSGVLDPVTTRRVKSIPVANNNYGQMKVDVALSGRIDMSKHNKWRRDGLDLRLPSHMIGTEAGIERTFYRSAAGLLPLPNDFSLWPVIPTALDPTQAPYGQDTLYLYSAIAPYKPEGGWSEQKAKAGQAIVDFASNFYGGLKSLEMGRQILTNDDIAIEANATGGNITHVDMTLSRTGPLRPALGLAGYRTPIEGLYIGGSGSHPGGGITGAPGFLGAREIIRDYSGFRRRPTVAH